VPTKSHRDFRTLVANLKADNVSDQEMHDSLAAWMDQRGVPMMLAEEYRDEPAIVRLFAERGVYLMTPEEKAGLDAETLTLAEVIAAKKREPKP
jgi:hypothetical protein